MVERLEDTIRRVVRDELTRHRLSRSPISGPSVESLAAAVRAEIARADKRPRDLVEVLGISRPTVAGRLSGTYPFKLAELDKIARFLDIMVQDIVDSAALGERFKQCRAEPAAPLTEVSPGDTWAQPSRARRRRPNHLTERGLKS